MWQCLEKVTGIAAGCVALAINPADPGMIVGTLVSVASFIGFNFDSRREHGLESRRALRKARKDAVTQSIEDLIEGGGLDAQLVRQWDKVLADTLPECMLDRHKLAAFLIDPAGFPVRATEHILDQLSLRAPLFAQGGARLFAERVIRQALENCYEDREYFALLGPYLWAAIGKSVGELKETTADIQQKVSETGDFVREEAASSRLRMDRIELGLEDIRSLLIGQITDARNHMSAEAAALWETRVMALARDYAGDRLSIDAAIAAMPEAAPALKQLEASIEAMKSGQSTLHDELRRSQEHLAALSAQGAVLTRNTVESVRLGRSTNRWIRLGIIGAALVTFAPLILFVPVRWAVQAYESLPSNADDIINACVISETDVSAILSRQWSARLQVSCDDAELATLKSKAAWCDWFSCGDFSANLQSVRQRLANLRNKSEIGSKPAFMKFCMAFEEPPVRAAQRFNYLLAPFVAPRSRLTDEGGINPQPWLGCRAWNPWDADSGRATCIPVPEAERTALCEAAWPDHKHELERLDALAAAVGVKVGEP